MKTLKALAPSVDFVWIDLEHNPTSLESLAAHLIAARAGGAPALVRVPSSDVAWIKRVLDTGAEAVIVPQIRPVGTFIVLLSIIGSFQLFELPYVLLNGTAGPDNRGLTVVMYLYQMGFDQGDLGYASAVGWLLAMLLVGITLLQRRLGGDSPSRRLAP